MGPKHIVQVDSEGELKLNIKALIILIAYLNHSFGFQINTTTDEKDPTNPFRFPNIGVEKFLELNSEQNHDDYCLAYVFTDRDFDDGVLGLAWVGAPSGSLSNYVLIFETKSIFQGRLNFIKYRKEKVMLVQYLNLYNSSQARFISMM